MAGPRLPTTPAKRRVRYSVITLAAVVIGLFVALPAHEEGMACGGPPELASEHRGAIPASYFGMHIHRAAAGPTWPSIEFFGWRLWDAYVTWPHLQPTREHWDWTRLDGLVNLAQEKRIEVLLPLGQSCPLMIAPFIPIT